MPVIEITSLDFPGVSVYSRLTERQLRSAGADGNGVFIAESPKVIRVALRAGYEPLSLMCERRHIGNDAADVINICGDVPVYTGDRALLSRLTGYELTRGVLCAMRRRPCGKLEDVCRNAERVVVIDNVVDSTNVGAIFRSAAALGVDAVVLTKKSCDPMTRRSVRVSMGSVFLVPWTWTDNPITDLRALGFRIAAMALDENSVTLDNERLKSEPKLAIIMGTEGEGLPSETISNSDYVVRIPMKHGVDSLNVAAASAVAFWELCRKK